MEHFMCPQNARTMTNYDGIGLAGDARCGDSLTIYIRVKDQYIEEISYLIFGCCAAVATSSMTSVFAKGKTLEEAMQLTEEDIVDALDGLPEDKLHCSVLGITALQDAIRNYQMNQEKENII